MDKHFNNELSKEVYDITYRYNNETIEETFKRVADNLASIEENKEYWSEQFFNIMNDFSFIPGGRILSNAGTGLKGTTYINCFVDGFIGEDQDSMGGIMDALKRQALILKSEGGYGFCADVMRPKGAFISGIANESPGAVKMLEMWDKQSEVITEGSGKKSDRKEAKQKIRKGAQMVTMSCWHPDIENFITVKQTSGKLTKFNMSVLCIDEFMNAVKNHLPWKLEFPDYEYGLLPFELLNKFDYSRHFKTVKDIYKEIWDGNLNEWKKSGLPIKVYKEYKDANELWDLIMKSTYNRNEPGVIFIDTVNRLNNLYYCEYINSSNPCGEQPLPIGGVCNLGSINLTRYIINDNWNYDKLKNDIPVIIRFMDNINDITNVSLEIQKENLQQKRRIGMGIMGYGSALIMMGIRYGSKKALSITNELMEFIANTAYQSSSNLASEKGMFPLFKKEYLQSNYIKNLSEETKKQIAEHGLRNSHLLTIAPTGNTSVFANNVSGGLEPVFMHKYKRTFMIPYAPAGLQIPIFINDGNLHSRDWKIEKEGDENIYTIEFNNEKYKYDNHRGLTKEADVIDYGVKYRIDNEIWNEIANYAVHTSNLKIEDHIETMKIFSKWIDSAISKTINLPNDYKFEDFENVYFKLWESGTIKGGTTYRAGTMLSVLSDDKINNTRNGTKITKTHAPKRPKDLPCDVHFVTAKGNQWVVFIGILGGDPYEVFALKEKQLHLPKRITAGILTKVKSGFYNFATEDGFLIEDITNLFERAEEEALTRLLSWGLRHGGGIEYAIDGLNKSEGTVISFAKAISRTLKKYVKEMNIKENTCPECGENTLIYQEGCISCTNCTYSKCS